MFFFGLVVVLELDDVEALDMVLVFFVVVEVVEGADEVTVVPEVLGRLCVVVLLVDREGADVEVCVVLAEPTPITLAYESMVLPT